MDSSRIHEVFRVAGKLIALGQTGEQYAEDIKAHVVATEEQVVAASGSPDPFAALLSFTVPLVGSMRNITQGLDRIPLVARAGLDNYLRTVAPELDESASAPPATLVNALKSAMQAAGDSVEPSGSFADYFMGQYAVALPQDEDATVPDSLITITVY